MVGLAPLELRMDGGKTRKKNSKKSFFFCRKRSLKIPQFLPESPHGCGELSPSRPTFTLSSPGATLNFGSFRMRLQNGDELSSRRAGKQKQRKIYCRKMRKFFNGENEKQKHKKKVLRSHFTSAEGAWIFHKMKFSKFFYGNDKVLEKEFTSRQLFLSLLSELAPFQFKLFLQLFAHVFHPRPREVFPPPSALECALRRVENNEMKSRENGKDTKTGQRDDNEIVFVDFSSFFISAGWTDSNLMKSKIKIVILFWELRTFISLDVSRL